MDPWLTNPAHQMGLQRLSVPTRALYGLYLDGEMVEMKWDSTPPTPLSQELARLWEQGVRPSRVTAPADGLYHLGSDGLRPVEPSEGA